MKVKVWGCRGSFPRPYTQEEKRAKDAALVLELIKSGKLSEITGEVTSERVNQLLDQMPENLTRTYGGNTTCYQLIVEGNERDIVFDAGTGIIEAGKAMLKQSFASQKPVEVDIYESHGHDDHTQGLVYFPPSYLKKTIINLFGLGTVTLQLEKAVEAHTEKKPGTRTRIIRREVKTAIDNLEKALDETKKAVGVAPSTSDKGKSGKPNGRMYNILAGAREDGRHPVSLEMQASLCGELKIEDIAPGFRKEYSKVVIESAYGNHPQGCLMYKATERATNRVLAYLGDWEHGARLDDLANKVENPRDFNREVVSFMTGAHVVVSDFQYRPDHYNGKGKFPVPTKGWGHPIDIVVIDLVAEAAEKSGHKITLVGSHHDPSYVDQFMDARTAELLQYMKETGKDKYVDLRIAREGDIIDV